MEPSLWKNRSFLLLWMAQVTANIGDQFYGIALLWYLLQKTKSASALSLIAIPEMIAGFLFYLIGGVLADRYSPRTLMVSADAARIVIVVMVGLMVASGVDEFSFFLTAQFFIGVFSTLFHPSKTVALKAVVPIEQLSRANAILDTTFRTIRILAPMTIGLLAAVVPIASLFFVNAASYLLSACFVYAIGKALLNGHAAGGTRMTAGQYWRDIGSAVRELTHNRLLFYILLFSNMGFIVWQVCWSVGLPVLADTMGKGDAGMLGVLVGCYGAGNLLGSLYMARLTYHRHLFVILMGWLIQSAGFISMALSQEVAWIVYLSAAIAGVGGPLIGIPTVTAIQTKVADSNTGKVYALNMLLFTFFSVMSSSMGALWLGSWAVHHLFLVSGLFLAAMIAFGLFLERKERQQHHQQSQLPSV
ncbi:MFS transporter [Brevibacillus sp. H7]|uniref:MFS transporter n=1 Tax=Brevibacillus sp. H7 TaxID=3349138 RepID=UPI0037F82D96